VVDPVVQITISAKARPNLAVGAVDATAIAATKESSKGEKEERRRVEDG
jgi:hypothetical protein